MTKPRTLDTRIEVNCTKTKCGECHFQHPECQVCIMFGKTLSGDWGKHQRLKECAVAEWKAKKPHFPDISDLSPELQSAMVETVDAILAVLRAHMNDPERGDTGWREQTVGDHFEHAHGHTDKILQYEMIDRDDGLPHEDHAMCRLMLAKARRKLTKGPNNDSR